MGETPCKRKQGKGETEYLPLLVFGDIKPSETKKELLSCKKIVGRIHVPNFYFWLAITCFLFFLTTNQKSIRLRGGFHAFQDYS